MADVWAAIIKDWATGNAIAESHLDEEIRDRATVLSLAVDGDGSTSTIKHRHKTGTLAARPTPGEAGRLYLATDVGLTLYDDGTEWLIGPPLPQKGIHFLDEFIMDYSKNWVEGVSGSGTVDMVAGAGGIVQLDTSTTSNSNAKILLPTSAPLANIDPAKIGISIIRLWTLQPTDVNQFIHSGLMDSVPSGSAKPNNGIYIEKNDAGNFYGVCRASSTETTQDLGTTASSDTLAIVERTATGVKFYTNTFNAAGLQGAEVTTNVPSAILLPAHRISNKVATTSRAFRLDTFGLWFGR